MKTQQSVIEELFYFTVDATRDSLAIFAVPFVVVGTGPLAAAEHVVLHAVVERERVEVVFDLVPLAFRLVVQHLLVDGLRLEGQLGGNPLEDVQRLRVLAVAAHLDDHPAALHRRHIVVDGALAAAHAVAETFAGHRLPGRVDAPHGEHARLVQLPVRHVADHVEVSGAQGAAVQGLRRQRGMRGPRGA